MAHQIFALLVGINQYPEGVNNLRGCVQDVENIRELLVTQYKVPETHIMCLTDAAANREAVINGFRTHLSQAQAGDTVFFHYSGHGSRETAPQEFSRFNPNDKNQTLVLADSREPDGLDLANKELAVLLQELSTTKADLVLNIDACHSGGITRSEGDLLKQTSRQTEKAGSTRPLESYLDGYYSQMLADRGEIIVPSIPHLVMSACTEYEVAQETRQGTGAYSSALIQALKTPTASYAQVFDLARIQLKQQGIHQNPGAVAYQGFNTMRQFLTHAPLDNPYQQNIYFLDDQWWINLGAIQGVTMDETQPTTIDIFAPDQPNEVLAKGIITEVQPQKSVVVWQDFAPDETQQYTGQITHIAIAPLAISNEGDKATQELIDTNLRSHRSVLVSLHPDLPNASYRLECLPEKVYLYDGFSGLKLQGIQSLGGADLSHIIDAMETVANWKRLLNLQNTNTNFDTKQIQLVLKEHTRGAEPNTLRNTTTLYGNRPKQINLDVHNELTQTLYFSLLAMSQDFGIEVLKNTSAKKAGEFAVTDKIRINVRADQNKYEAWYTYLLMVSTDQIDDFVLTQDGLKLGYEALHKGGPKGLISRHKSKRKPNVENDWFTQRVSLKLVKELLELKPDVGQVFQVPDSILGVKGHNEVSAWLCLESAFSQIRKEPAETLLNAMTQCHWQAIDLLTGEQKLHVLTLNQLQNADKVTSENPLEFRLELELGSDETLLAMAYYGEQVHTLGEAHSSEVGVTTLALHQLVVHPDNDNLCQICLVKGKKGELAIDFLTLG
jgi:hypothetical protein